MIPNRRSASAKKWEPVFAALTFGSEKIMVKQE
jgi:hypothetical protein